MSDSSLYCGEPGKLLDHLSHFYILSESPDQSTLEQFGLLYMCLANTIVEETMCYAIFLDDYDP